MTLPSSVVLAQPIISANDSRQYRSLVLSNQLRVLLIEAPASPRAAASMAVNVGHFDNPTHRLGMAHFLEHMLFLGTKKYPEADAYQSFIKNHGGNHNAWTGNEHTNYFFSINAEVLEEALDRFSQFFIAPSFSVEYVNRERQAIESEFSLKLKDDLRRAYQVHKETTNPEHPFCQFSVGNLTTLNGDQQQLRDELAAFYQQHYSANLMTFCLSAPLPLDQQQDLVEQYFAAIDNKNLSKQYPQAPLYLPSQLGCQIDIVPLKDSKKLILTFALPNVRQRYPRKPLTFISHLLGTEGQGSLLSYLKQQGWVTHLRAGGGNNGYNFQDYEVSLQLTEAGLTQTTAIIEAIFAYLQLIKTHGLSAWRYQERSKLLQQAFRFQEPIEAIDLVSHLSVNMQFYPTEDIIFGDYRMDGFDLCECQKLLALLTTDNLRLTLIAPSQTSEQHTMHTASWYDTPYQVQAFTDSQVQRWQQPKINASLKLPEPNPFLIDKPQVAANLSPQLHPKLIADQLGYRLWYKQDNNFHVPKGHLYLSVDSLTACATPTQAALTHLYVSMLLDYLGEYTYPAEVAGLSYDIYPHQGGFTLYIAGFSEHQEQLLDLIIEKARARQFHPDKFQIIKQQLLTAWHNVSLSKPISQLFTSLSVTLQYQNYEPSRLAECLAPLQLTDLLDHVHSFYQQIHLEGLMYGNWQPQAAQHFSVKINHLLEEISQPMGELKRQLIDIRGKGSLLRELTIQHPDSAILVYYQSPSTGADAMALFSLFNHTMSSMFFHELRTKQQLGYMVGTNYLPIQSHPGLIFYIQSPSHTPKQLLEAIDGFMQHFNYGIMQMTTSQWQASKTGLIQQIMKQDANQRSRGQRYWHGIANKDVDFSIREKVVAAIEQLNRADLIRFNINHLCAKTADRLVLHSQGDKHRHAPSFLSANTIHDLNSFKTEMKSFVLDVRNTV